jgi:hypothetical protein
LDDSIQTTGFWITLRKPNPVPSLLFCVLCVTLRAQNGLVKSGNQPIPGATLTATQDDKKFVTTTDQDGRYTFPPLSDGIWAVEIRMFGFEPVKKQVNYSKTKLADFSLQLREAPAAGRMTQVAGNRSNGQAGSQLDSQIQSELSSNQGQQPASPAGGSQNSNEAFLISGSLSQGLSPNAPSDSGPNPQSQLGGGRDPFSGQAPNAPGFGGGGGGGGFGGPGGGGFGGRGGGPGGFGRRGDGPPQGRQFGNRRQATGIHGMAFFNLGNSALNAKPFSITGQEIAQPAYAQSRFGVVAGGPLVIPKLIKDPSTTFFISYFGTRSKGATPEVATVPTQLERQGNFSQAVQSAGPVQIFDPVTHQPFAGNIVPASRLDPIAQKLMGYVPLPNQPGLVNNYELFYAVPQNSDNASLRIQRNITKKDRLSFQINGQRRDGDTIQTFGFLDTTSGYGLRTNLGWTRNISPRVVSNAQVTFNRNVSQATPFFANGPDVAAQLGIAGTSANPLNYGPPNLNFTNFGALSDGTPNLTRNQSQSASESVIWSRGTHTFTWGVQFTRSDLNNQTDQNGRGTFNFTGQATSAFDARGLPIQGTGFDFADFLLGLPQSSSIRYGDSSTYFRQNVWNGYFTDDWKAKPSLTLNLGVRYEYFSPLSEKYGRMANLDIAPAYTAVAVVTPGETGPYTGKFPSGLINPDYKNFSPRIGLAWKVPRFKRSTIVRAGYGIYYNGQAYIPFGLRLAGQPPFAVSNNVNTSAQQVLMLATGFVAVSPAEVTNTYAIDRNYRTPYAQTWNLSIQHDLGKGFFVELGYLGTKGTRLDVQTLPNEGPGALRQRNQLGNAVGFTYDSSVGNSIYHAAQVRFTRRFNRGISMQAFYSFSKSIDDSSTFGGAGNTVAQNWLDLAAERGLSSFDRRQSFDMNWTLSSPAGNPGSRIPASSLTGRLLRDWQLSGGLAAQTGTPLTARVLGNGAKLAQTGGTGSGRANATGLDLASASGFFNLGAFAAPSPGQFGDAGRNTIPGPSLLSVNAAFGRSFQFGESRRRLEFRLEANNVLNQVNYTNINTVVNATNYGLPMSASSMRAVTAVLRFRF